MMTRNQTLMAAALGGFMLAATISAASAEDRKGNAEPSPDTMGECHGVNACKGTGACNGAGNSCQGMNSCKGKGWVKSTKAECDKKGGQFKPS